MDAQVPHAPSPSLEPLILFHSALIPVLTLLTHLCLYLYLCLCLCLVAATTRRSAGM